ncbi:MAG: hypothetical protein LBQ09_04580 [Acidobacteriaceae bacterium]|nr:hypothetical protein [Acidobacteriaceae bacterium]
MDAPARLTISRTSERDAQQRQIFVTLDGKEMGDLVFGETLSREISPGPHTLKANNTMVWKTVKFDAAPGEEIRFTATNYSGKGFLTFMLFVGVAPLYLSLERDV